MLWSLGLAQVETGALHPGTTKASLRALVAQGGPILSIFSGDTDMPSHPQPHPQSLFSKGPL